MQFKQEIMKLVISLSIVSVALDATKIRRFMLNLLEFFYVQFFTFNFVSFREAVEGVTVVANLLLARLSQLLPQLQLWYGLVSMDSSSLCLQFVLRQKNKIHLHSLIERL
jgi:hypothetical protein